MEPRIGIIGVGNMGGAMAARLLSFGWTVRVCDIDAVKVESLERLGAIRAVDSAAAARGSGTLIVCVVDAAQTQQVLFGQAGAVAAMVPGDAVVLCPTLAPEDVESVAARLSGLGIGVIDAPMSGGPARARDGTMSLMVACADGLFESRRALIDSLSTNVFRVSGKPGDGARTKLVNNLLAGINLVGAAEALAMAQRMGLDLRATLNVIEQSSGQSWVGSDRMRRAVAGDYEPRAHLSLLTKDTALAVAAARAAGFDNVLGAHARDAFAEAAKAGFAGSDDAAMFQWIASR